MTRHQDVRTVQVEAVDKGVHRRSVAGLGALGLALGLLVSQAPVTAASATSPASGPSQPVVVTDAGPVRGVVDGRIGRFLGVPYAAPPVGDLRWRPPRRAPQHTGVLDATSFAPHCAQGPSFFATASTSEDCLYLNVYRPVGATPQTQLPVMVWLHGGGLLTGQSDVNDPSPLVRNGVIVVTINYRLGALGFLAHPALSREGDGSSGNYGLMDQQAALRWVQRNIVGFGGNPNNVTLFGNSAGGQSVLYQMVSPRAKGLFHRGIVQSGADVLTQVSQVTANAAGRTFAEAAGCPGQRIRCLRRLTVEQILAAQRQDFYDPNIDGRVLPRSLSTALPKGQFHRVPLMNGSNADEGRLFVAFFDLFGGPVTPDSYRPALAAFFGADVARITAIAQRYPLRDYRSPDLALAAAVTDGLYACNARRVDRWVSRYVPTYAYEFADRAAPPYLPPVSFPYGAFHGAEVQYLLDLPEIPGLSSQLSADQRRLAATMRRYWTGFATLGSPGATGAAPTWPTYSRAREQVQRLAPPTPTTVHNLAGAHRCGFWRDLGSSGGTSPAAAALASGR